ncbi:lytic polysaccharide monooxygenase [uncultured Vibrio sp.]|uniref:lytic polysaccharide monooxygenase n=1 Tax=uncultured Vibrio sp. TaxID=114054 RepID=UPI002612BACF|nr:lytic polysaccharide monooxygenase [uncultured Vibrio sp.]
MSAHGFVSGDLPGRAALCSSRDGSGPLHNTQCGGVQWEPQSVEGPEGFPEAGPADGTIAAAGSPAWAPLNEQSDLRWHRNQISAGHNVFTWQKTAAHVTKDWKYYITKEGWNPNQPLTRAQLDLVPFCEVDGHMTQPDMLTTHECTVPEREGYHLILAVWDVGDTDQAFYNVIDVEFDGDNTPAPTPEWDEIGSISSQIKLDIGDKVYTRVFDNEGENTSMSTSLIIDESTTDFNQWSYALSTKINSEHTQIQAGVLNSEDVAQPVYGQNNIYALSSSSLSSVEIAYDYAEVPEYDVTVTGLESTYIISNEPTQF